MISIDLMCRMTGAQESSNMLSVLDGLAAGGDTAGLLFPHRLACYVAQIGHESASFRYDREVWGPTSAQLRYEGRADLGNTQAGDGYKFRGRGPIQVTGRANTAEFRDWCRDNADPGAPDFEETPDLINTDPWEGLSPIWYWSTRDINRYADTGDMEMVTRKINGGLNGYADRLARYDRAALVQLGFEPGDIRGFQASIAGLAVDGISGPKTRAAMHSDLSALEPLTEDHTTPASTGDAELRALVAEFIERATPLL